MNKIRNGRLDEILHQRMRSNNLIKERTKIHDEITSLGQQIVKGGGWLKYLEKQKSKEEREDILLDLRIKTAEEQIKKMKQKFLYIVIGMLVSLVGSLLYTYIMTYKD